MQHVALVFDVFDDRNQDAGVALPEEHAINVTDGIACDEILDLAIVVAEDDHRNVELLAPDFAGKLRGIHVTDGQIGYDEVELRIGTGQFERLGTTGDVGNAGNLPQVQFERLVNQQFTEPSVFAQDERVVETGDQKDVLNAERHQVLEAFEALFSVEDGLGNAGK